MENIGIIGTGSIGLPIAKRIVKAGHGLSFFARHDNVIQDLIQYGAVYMDEIEKLGKHCAVIFLFVNDYKGCSDCINHLLVEMERGIIVVGSTISPEETLSLCHLCEPKKDVHVISAPVTGGVQGAKDGTLTTIISGKQTLIDSLNEVILSYSKKIVYLGEDVSRACSMKALVQYLVAVNTAALSEVYLLGVHSGLPPEAIYDVVTHSSGTTKIFESRCPTIMKNDFHKRGTIKIMAKDLNIVMDMAKTNGTPLLIGALVKSLFDAGNSSLDNQEDFSAIFKLYQRMM